MTEEEADALRSTIRTQRSIIKHYRGQCKRQENMLKYGPYKAWWLLVETECAELLDRLKAKDAHLAKIRDRMRQYQARLRAIAEAVDIPKE